MIVTITEPMERTEKEVLEFLLHQIALELPFEQFVEYFETKDLDRVRELWEGATVEWSEMIREREMDYSDMMY